MKLTLQNLSFQLEKGPLPIYLVSSDEWLLAQDAIHTICHAVLNQGTYEHIILNIEAGTEWESRLYESTRGLSLFSEKRLIELNLSQTKLDRTHTKIFIEYTKNLPTDVILIVQTAKLDKKVEQSAWYQAIDNVGGTLVLWPLSIEQLPAWAIQRAKRAGITLTKEAAERLAILVEGNLLAANIEIEKLALLKMDQPIDVSIIEAHIEDHAHFDVFKLVDSALLGKSARCLRILQNLAEEGVEPSFILWALTRELRILADIQQGLSQGKAFRELCTKHRVWEKHQIGLKSFLKRATPQFCWELLLMAGKIDRIIKGAEKGALWQSLENLATHMAGNGIIKV